MEFEKYTVKKIIHPNGVVFKFDNRRVAVVKSGNSFYIESTIMTDKLEPRAAHTVLKNKAVVTTLKFSQESTELLMVGIAEMLGYEICKK